MFTREYTPGKRKTWNQGYCVQAALNISFALLSQLTDRRHFCVCFDFRAVESSRQTRRIFSTITNSLIIIIPEANPASYLVGWCPPLLGDEELVVVVDHLSVLDTHQNRINPYKSITIKILFHWIHPVGSV